jgi:DNA-binding NarL/FixJ family response regulator
MTKSLLIVDDHAGFRRAARKALSGAHWEVTGEAVNGADGIAEAQRLTPDLVLLDVGLPDASGIEVARQIRGHHPEMTIVLTSTRDSDDYREMAMTSGANGFVSKADLHPQILRDFLER